MRHILLAFVIFLFVLIVASIPKSHARDNGQYPNSPLRAWFDTLTDKRGMSCCSTSDGIALEDPDWDVVADPAKPTVHYRVHIDGQWMDIPDEAVITEPNRAQKTMVWMVNIVNVGKRPRCFLPGAMT